MRTALASLCLLLLIAAPAWADRVVEMGQPTISGVFMGPHAADCVDETGERSAAAINGCFDRNIDPVTKAWQRALGRNLMARGRLSVHLHIAASGEVESVDLVSADPVLDQPFRLEVLNIVKNIDFRKAAGSIEVTHTFSFVPQ